MLSVQISQPSITTIIICTINNNDGMRESQQKNSVSKRGNNYSNKPISSGLTIGTSRFMGTKTSSPFGSLPNRIVDACVIDPNQFAFWIPSFVRHSNLLRFASSAAVIVDPLLPPQPTSIKPNFGTWQSVAMVSDTFSGVTFEFYVQHNKTPPKIKIDKQT